MQASVHTPGSGYVLLHHVMGESDGARGIWSYVSLLLAWYLYCASQERNTIICQKYFSYATVIWNKVYKCCLVHVTPISILKIEALMSGDSQKFT